MREKKRSKSDVIKDLQQREFEQQARMMQLETRHHELLQKTVMLDAENKNLKAVLQNMKTVGGGQHANMNFVSGGNQHSELKRPSSPLDNHIHPIPHHLLQHHHSSHDEDDFFTSASPVVMFEHQQQHQQHPHHPPPQYNQHHSHLINSMFAHFSNNTGSPLPTLDGLHHHGGGGHGIDSLHMDIMMSPMDSSSSPTPSSSNGTSPAETTRVELHDMDLVEESKSVHQA